MILWEYQTSRILAHAVVFITDGVELPVCAERDIYFLRTAFQDNLAALLFKFAVSLLDNYLLI